MGDIAVAIFGKISLPQGGKEGGTKDLCIGYSVPRAIGLTRWGSLF